ncbi:metallophosphoesterase family protein [Pseudooceanicola sp. C21-150M6]|uniref:metallophosphoesterase family protein n=1 Tax=Pseudooceanicola sp. C21-150M6 TaxID=3434355 RepID=UPI003D7FE62B
MLKTLFSPSRDRRPRFTAPLAPENPLCVVGDLHGRADLLERLLASIDANPVARQAQLVFVGDLIDRGPDSRGVLDRLYSLSRSGKAFCILGNHEEMMLQFLADPVAGLRWLRHGGMATLESYGIEAPAHLAKRPAEDTPPVQELLDTLRDRLTLAIGPDILKWLRNMRTVFANGNIAVVHAGCDPTLPIFEQERDHLIWGHPQFEQQIRRDSIWVLHGHTVIDLVKPIQGRINVDTGAYLTNRLSAVLIQPDGGMKIFDTELV